MILDALVAELQIMVYANVSDISIFSSVSSNLSFIMRHVIGNRVQMKLKWICQLLALFCLHCGESICSQVLTTILRKCSELKILTSILRYVEQSFPNILASSAVQAITNVNQEDLLQLFTNLVAVIGFGRQDQQITRALLLKLNRVLDQLNNEDGAIAASALRLVTLVPLTDKPDTTIMTNLTYEVVSLIFGKLCTEDGDKTETEYILQNCRKLLSDLSSSSSMLFLVLRMLVQGSFSANVSRWFGSKSRKIVTKDRKPFSLIDENRKHSRSLPLPQSHSTVLYTGVIGNGIRIAEKRAPIPDLVIVENKHYLLQIIRECCISSSDAADNKPNIESMSKLSLLMVELVSPDVMFNGLPWPDEDFLKVSLKFHFFFGFYVFPWTSTTNNRQIHI